ncbi:hypothetical protein Holit_02012 [Hollandina sp. SP2]
MSGLHFKLVGTNHTNLSVFRNFSLGNTLLSFIGKKVWSQPATAENLYEKYGISAVIQAANIPETHYVIAAYPFTCRQNSLHLFKTTHE